MHWLSQAKRAQAAVAIPKEGCCSQDTTPCPAGVGSLGCWGAAAGLVVMSQGHRTRPPPSCTRHQTRGAFTEQGMRGANREQMRRLDKAGARRGKGVGGRGGKAAAHGWVRGGRADASAPAGPLLQPQRGAQGQGSGQDTVPIGSLRGAKARGCQDPRTAPWHRCSRPGT